MKIFSPSLKTLAVIVATVSASAIAVAVTSVLIAKDVIPVRRLGNAIVRYIEGPPEQAGRRIESILVMLEIEQAFQVPRATHLHGGGLSSFGPELLVVNNDGRLFSIVDGRITEAPFKGPDNGYAGYASTAERLREQGYTFQMNRLRYNDILVVGDGDDRHLLVSYVEWLDREQCYRNSISGIRLPKDYRTLSSMPTAQVWRTVFSTKPCLPLKKPYRAMEGHMSGGKMADLGNGQLAYTSGDFHWDGAYGPLSPDQGSSMAIAQDPDYQYGKVLQVDWRDGRSEVVTRGTRNMQGIAVTPDGRIWTVEHGPRGGDELNLHVRGRNFGWPLRTYGTQYNLLPHPGASPYGRHDGFDAPAYAWMPSAAVSGLTVSSGFHEAWEGDLIASSLKASALFRIRIEGERAVYAEQIPLGTPIRAVAQQASGTLAVLTDDDRVWLLRARKGGLAIEAFRAAAKDAVQGESLAAKVDSAIVACAECHSFEPDSNDASPTLANLWGRSIASTDYARHSPRLSARSDHWDAATLDKFLSDPQRFAPGTTMPDPGLEPDVRQGLIRTFEVAARNGL
jgi:cytochrome c2